MRARRIPLWRTHLVVLVVLGALGAAVIAGCGTSSSSSSSRGSTEGASGPPSTAPAASAIRAAAVTIASFMFTPATLTVKKGASVSFENKDNASHTVTADDGSFDGGTLAPGASKTLTFSKAGKFTYHCAFHPFMHGTIVVQ